jgi:hypothetical protein
VGSAVAAALLDTTALELFWALTGKLEAGEPVPEEDWRCLFATPAYSALFKEHYSASMLRPRFELAFGKGREAEAVAAAAVDTLVEHYLRVKAQRDELQRFYRTMDLSAVIAEAVRRAAEWLPAGVVARGRQPGATILVYDVAMRGADPVMFDALFAYHLGESHLVLAAAHTIYHNYCQQFQKPLRPTGIPELDRLGHTLEVIHDEGIADLINVERWIFQGGPVYAGGPLGNTRWVNRMREALQEAPAFLTLLDQVACAGLADPHQVAEQIPALLEHVPGGGHGPGYYMARKIVLAGLKHDLIATALHPVRFLDLYTRACRATGEPCEISDRGMAFLRKFEA